MHDHDLLFMPTAGFGFDNTADIQSQIDSVKRQIQVAIDSKARGVIHFVGLVLRWIWKRQIFTGDYYELLALQIRTRNIQYR